MGISFGDCRKRPLVEITGDMVGKRHAVSNFRSRPAGPYYNPAALPSTAEYSLYLASILDLSKQGVSD
jgi:hypothetical protein